MTNQPTPRTSLDDLLSGPGTAGAAKPARAPGPGPGDGPNGPGSDFEITPRPRRRITRLTAALALLAAAAAGFAGGLYALGRPANAGAASPADAGLTGGSQPGAGGGITGTLNAVKGSTIYITDTHGKTVAIRISRSTAITNTTTATPAQLSPGEHVTVQGTRAADGSYRAASITAGKPATGGFPAPAGHP